MTRALDEKEFIGKRFNMLTVLSLLPPQKHRRAIVKCDCGKEKTVSICNLRTLRSCGTCRGARNSGLRHGHARGRDSSPEYRTWRLIKDRCHNPMTPAYSSYGGQGINVCDRWRGSFENFLADMGPRPPNPEGKRRYWSIDRIDNNKGYEPGNCRWATPAEQRSNTRQHRYIIAFGETKTLTEWCRQFDLKVGTVQERLSLGWHPERALAERPRVTARWPRK